MSRNSQWINVLTTAVTPMIWGSTYIVTSQILPPDRPFTAALLRALPAGMLLVLASRYLLPRRLWGRILVLSALNIGVFQALLFIAAYRLPGGQAAVIGATQPLMVMFLARTVDGVAPRRQALFGCLALLLSSGQQWDLIGVLAATAGAMSMACGTFLSQRWQSGIPLLALTGWQLLLGGLMLLPVALTLEPALPPLSLSQCLGYGYLSLFGALLAYVLWFRGISRLSPVAVSSLGLLSPLTAVILGWTLLNQTLSAAAMLGMVIVLAGILAVQTSRR